MFKKVLLCVCLCCALVIGMACPAFASTVGPMGGYVFVEKETFPESSFVSSGGGTIYKVPSFTPNYDLTKADTCIVAYCGQSMELNWFYYSNQQWEMLYCIGNIALIDGSQPDNGLGFLLCLWPGNASSSFFVCSPDFYRDYVDGTGDKGFTISISLPAAMTEQLTASVGTGLTDVLGFAGAVVTALVSPDGALFGLLPVVGMAVGLAAVVWGIKKFKSCTWGF